MADGDSNITIKRFGVEIAAVIVAALILWLCSTTESHSNRISVLENSYSHISKNIEEVKCLIGDVAKEVKQQRQED